MDQTPQEVAAGHAFDTWRTLAVYDPPILSDFSSLAWRCPAGRILAGTVPETSSGGER